MIHNKVHRKKYFYIGVVKWYIVFIDNYVDKMLILFSGPSHHLNRSWLNICFFCVFILMNMYFKNYEWCKRCSMNLYICRTKLLYVINVYAILKNIFMLNLCDPRSATDQIFLFSI